jgi:hypothetical protein
MKIMLMPETRKRETRKTQKQKQKQIPIFDTVYVQTPRTESHVDCSNKIRVATNKNCEKENRHSIISTSAFVPKKKTFP